MKRRSIEYVREMREFKNEDDERKILGDGGLDKVRL
jgi:hypothetical protein